MTTYERFMAGKPLTHGERDKIKTARELARLLAEARRALKARG